MQKPKTKNVTKKEVVEFFGGAVKLSMTLNYASRNVVYAWDEVLSDRQLDMIVVRAKAKRIKIPAHWQ